MLKLTPMEFLVRGLPEAFLFIIAAYAFSKKVINIRKYIISSILYGIMTYLVRFLPIHYGVHTIINVFALIIITVNINKIDLISSIRSAVTTIILQFICEGINVLIIQYIFNTDINYVFSDPVLKTLYGIPSIIVFACVAIIYYIRLLRRKELKCI
ncbi:branched-subunit amino acid transport protein AzlD [Clostridium pascui]|uniref:hypothetical protein n=1 Tax=Clostridium pascui TaxID=46609 RepID=UPI00195DC49C|nr:hypothetical protein [Clostridium pascui]MBM7871358.1 branched-subunit amino acid transport protein AzlD [Clostridium pascui]